MAKETMYLVTDIEFDFEDSMGELPVDEQISINMDAIGLWYAEDGDHLCDKITEKTGFCIISIDYTTNTLHPLTSYL